MPSAMYDIEDSDGIISDPIENQVLVEIGYRNHPNRIEFCGLCAIRKSAVRICR